MSAFELYYIQGIRQYKATDISREKDYKVVIKGARKTNSLHCPLCGSKDVTTKGWKERAFIGVPIVLLKTKRRASPTGFFNYFIVSRFAAEP